MAKSLASLQAVVGARIVDFENKMRAVESRTQSTARIINRAKPRVDIDTSAANRKLAALEKRASGMRLAGGLNPATVGVAIVSAAIMRAATQTEEGKKFIESIDRIATTVITPLLEALVPGVEMLERTISDLSGALRQTSTMLPNMTLYPRQESNAGALARYSWAGLLAPFMGRGTISSVLNETLRNPGRPTPPREGSPGTFMFGQQFMNQFFARAESAQRFQQVLSSLQSSLNDIRTGGGMAGQIAGLDTAHGQRMGPMFQRIENLQALIAGGGPFVAALTDQLNVARGLVRVSEEQHRAQQQKLTAMNRELTIQQRLTSMRQSAEALNAAALSPLEVFTNRMAELNRLMSAGAGLTPQALAFHQSQAFATLQAAVGTAPTQGVGFVQGGSAEAQAAIDAFNRQGGQANVQEQIKGILQQALAQQTAAAAAATETARALTRNPIVLGVGPRLPRP